MKFLNNQIEPKEHVQMNCNIIDIQYANESFNLELWKRTKVKDHKPSIKYAAVPAVKAIKTYYRSQSIGTNYGNTQKTSIRHNKKCIAIHERRHHRTRIKNHRGPSLSHYLVHR